MFQMYPWANLILMDVQEEKCNTTRASHLIICKKYYTCCLTFVLMQIFTEMLVIFTKH